MISQICQHPDVWQGERQWVALEGPLLPAIVVINLLKVLIIITLIIFENMMKSYSLFLNSSEHVDKAEFRDNNQPSPHGERC